MDNEWRVMLEEIMFVVLQHDWEVKVSGRRNRAKSGERETYNSVSAAVPAPQHLICSEMK